MSARACGSGRSLAILTVSLGLLGSGAGCAPVVDVVGVYFPGWLVSTVAGLILAYVIVISLSRRPQTRQLGDSGLLFIALATGIALSMWWMFFSGF